MNTAFIDFLGVTFSMPAELAKEAAEKLLTGWLGVECTLTDTGKGWNGYKHRQNFDGGLVAWGGNSDTVHIEINGSGCVQVKDWYAVADSIDILSARITRIDLAVDDFDGAHYSIDWCRQQFETGGFDPARGSKPVARLIDDMGSGKGKTFYVGSRTTGKLFRGYEKGREQGDPESNWFRLEVEQRNRHRELTTDMIRDPGAYFAGAYECLKAHSLEQRTIKTFAHAAAANLEKAADHAKKQAGRVIYALLSLGHSAEEVLARLMTPELPKRLAGPIRAYLALDESERTHTTALAPAWATKATPEELCWLHKAIRLPRSIWRVGQDANGQHTTFEATEPNRLWRKAHSKFLWSVFAAPTWAHS